MEKIREHARRAADMRASRSACVAVQGAHEQRLFCRRAAGPVRVRLIGAWFLAPAIDG